jgi:hypothetical protein
MHFSNVTLPCSNKKTTVRTLHSTGVGSVRAPITVSLLDALADVPFLCSLVSLMTVRRQA